MTSPGRSMDREVSPWATGWALFASVMMIMIGIFHILMGLAAIIDDDFFVVAPDYTFDVDTTAWGWIHLIGGSIVAIAGFAVISGQVWARAIGILWRPSAPSPTFSGCPSIRYGRS